jgi:hypothetical protein
MLMPAIVPAITPDDDHRWRAGAGEKKAIPENGLSGKQLSGWNQNFFE